MGTLLGIPNIRVFTTVFEDSANEFFAIHDGCIIDFFVTDKGYIILYQEVTVDG